jgi:uncharacterized protein involved in outer membrane biogenesis
MSTWKKAALIVAIALVVIVGGLAIAIPMLLDVDRYRPEVVAHIQQETGKPSQIGRLALTILPQVAIRVDDFTLGNPAGFPQGDFVKARRIYAVVNPYALLHRQVEITSLELNDPDIHLLSDVHGKWNFESPPAKSAAPGDPPAEAKASFALGLISKLSVKGGQVAVESLLPSGAPGPAVMEVHGASVDLRDVDLNALSTASLARPGSPPGGFTAWAGAINAIVHAAAAEAPLVAQGTLKADALRFETFAVTKLKSKMRLYPKQVFFDDLDVKGYSGDVTGNVSLSFGGANLSYAVDASLKDVSVAQFLDAFPQTRGKMTGTLVGTAKLNGEATHSADPLAGIRGAGQMSIQNGVMPSLQLNRNLRLLAQMASLGPANGDPSSFSSISADFTIADEKLSSTKLSLVGNGVDVDGSGHMTMAGEGSLDYQGVAKVAAGSSPLANVLMGLSGATLAEGKLTFPFTLGGTLANPKFSLKGGGASGLPGTVQGAAQQPADLVRGIAGMFKKKKKPQ